MRSVVVRTVIAEYDLIDGHVSTSVIESFFGKPLAVWDHSGLEAGEAETVQSVSVRGAGTLKIEIIREDNAVWVTYAVTLEIDFNPNALAYFGVTLDDIVVHGCQVSFPIDDRIVDLVDEKGSTRVT
jgi:hypothetical protein